MQKFWAGGFLYNPKNNSVLLHKRDVYTQYNPNKYAFFGGLNKKSETPVKCFIRELKEELGIDINPQEVKPLCDYLNKEFDTYRYVFYVESDIKKSKMTLDEGADFDWVEISHLNKYDLTDKTIKDLKLFVNKIK